MTPMLLLCPEGAAGITNPTLAPASCLGLWLQTLALPAHSPQPVCPVPMQTSTCPAKPPRPSFSPQHLPLPWHLPLFPVLRLWTELVLHQLSQVCWAGMGLLAHVSAPHRHTAGHPDSPADWERCGLRPCALLHAAAGGGCSRHLWGAALRGPHCPDGAAGPRAAQPLHPHTARL